MTALECAIVACIVAILGCAVWATVGGEPKPPCLRYESRTQIQLMQIGKTLMPMTSTVQVCVERQASK